MIDMDKINVELSDKCKSEIKTHLDSLSKEDAMKLLRAHEELAYYSSKIIGGIESLRLEFLKILKKNG